MDREQTDLFVKVHNELLKRMRIDADKYEREDSCWGAFVDFKNGRQDMKEALIEAFELVYDVVITDAVYDSCYAVCKGWK